MNQDEQDIAGEPQVTALNRHSGGSKKTDPQRPDFASVQDRYGARAAIRKGNRAVVLILVFSTLVSVPVAGILRAWPGALAALAAMGIMWIVAAVGIGANQLVLRDPERTSMYVFGAYLVKLVIVLAAVALLRPVSKLSLIHISEPTRPLF